jgi:hypothetical protein
LTNIETNREALKKKNRKQFGVVSIEPARAEGGSHTSSPVKRACREAWLAQCCQEVPPVQGSLVFARLIIIITKQVFIDKMPRQMCRRKTIFVIIGGNGVNHTNKFRPKS